MHYKAGTLYQAIILVNIPSALYFNKKKSLNFRESFSLLDNGSKHATKFSIKMSVETSMDYPRD